MYVPILILKQSIHVTLADIFYCYVFYIQPLIVALKHLILPYALDCHRIYPHFIFVHLESLFY